MDVKNLKTLYKDGFPEDTERYVDYFFNSKVNYSKIFTKKVNEEVISVLYLIDKWCSFNGEDIEVPFIVAASTLTEYRGKKHLESVMEDAFKYLDKLRVPFVCLYPFKHSYYNKYGFFTIDFVDEYKFKYVKDNLKSIEIQKTKDYNLISSLYNKYLFKVNKIIRTPETVKKRIEELYAEGGEAYIIKSNNINLGYLMISDEIDEIIYSGDISDLNCCKLLEGKEAQYYLLGANKFDNTMGKIINLEAFLMLLKYKTESSYNGNVLFKREFLNDVLLQINLKNGIITVNEPNNSIVNDTISEKNLIDAAFLGKNNDNKKGFLSCIKFTNTYFIEKF